MTASTRDLFERAEIPDEVVSLSHSLSNHVGSRGIGLREAHRRFTEKASGDGYERGCHEKLEGMVPDAKGKLAHVVPSWVSVHDDETRTLEGVLTKSKVTYTDFPLSPWHTSYDWNFYVDVDPQYTYLLSEHRNHDGGGIECEWESAAVPSWAWPHEGERILMVGRWIYDCGHVNPDTGLTKSELHPGKAVVAFRREAAEFAGNDGPTRASKAAVYVGREGGYWRHAIDDQDYAFDLYLPPKPDDGAEPVWSVEHRTGPASVTPRIEPFPAYDPRALRVVVPLEGVTPHPEEYGAFVWGGWSDPRGTESDPVQRLTVDFDTFELVANLDTGWKLTAAREDWYVYVGVNGHWTVLEDVGGWEHDVDLSVDLDVHRDDRLRVTVAGYDADEIDDYMGEPSGFTWEEISDPSQTVSERMWIVQRIFTQLVGSYNDENDPIGYGFREHAATDRGEQTLGADAGTSSDDPGDADTKDDYELTYHIRER